MIHTELITAAENFAKEQLGQDTTGHDWFHTNRVRNTAALIARMEGASVVICTVAALLHDVADEKLNPSRRRDCSKYKLGSPHICRMKLRAGILWRSSGQCRSAAAGEPMSTLEGQVVQDADRLDALGAIGITRTMVFSGAKGRPVYDPEIPPRDESLQKEYRDYSKGTAVNHFYEKLLKLKDLMNTPYGKQLAEERHQFMLIFLEQFDKEWNQGAE